MSISPEPTYTVLLVDDNLDLLRAMSFALEEPGGFRVICASDGYVFPYFSMLLLLLLDGFSGKSNPAVASSLWQALR